MASSHITYTLAAGGVKVGRVGDHVFLRHLTKAAGKTGPWGTQLMKDHLDDPNLVVLERAGRRDGYALTPAGLQVFQQAMHAQVMTPAMKALDGWITTTLMPSLVTTSRIVTGFWVDLAANRATVQFGDGSARIFTW